MALTGTYGSLSAIIMGMSGHLDKKKAARLKELARELDEREQARKEQETGSLVDYRSAQAGTAAAEEARLGEAATMRQAYANYGLGGGGTGGGAITGKQAYELGVAGVPYPELAELASRPPASGPPVAAPPGLPQPAPTRRVPTTPAEEPPPRGTSDSAVIARVARTLKGVRPAWEAGLDEHEQTLKREAAEEKRKAGGEIRAQAGESRAAATHPLDMSQRRATLDSTEQTTDRGREQQEARNRTADLLFSKGQAAGDDNAKLYSEHFRATGSFPAGVEFAPFMAEAIAEIKSRALDSEFEHFASLVDGFEAKGWLDSAAATHYKRLALAKSAPGGGIDIPLTVGMIREEAEAIWPGGEKAGDRDRFIEQTMLTQRLGPEGAREFLSPEEQKLTTKQQDAQRAAMLTDRYVELYRRVDSGQATDEDRKAFARTQTALATVAGIGTVDRLKEQLGGVGQTSGDAFGQARVSGEHTVGEALAAVLPPQYYDVFRDSATVPPGLDSTDAKEAADKLIGYLKRNKSSLLTEAKNVQGVFRYASELLVHSGDATSTPEQVAESAGWTEDERRVQQLPAREGLLSSFDRSYLGQRIVDDAQYIIEELSEAQTVQEVQKRYQRWVSRTGLASASTDEKSALREDEGVQQAIQKVRATATARAEELGGASAEPPAVEEAAPAESPPGAAAPRNQASRIDGAFSSSAANPDTRRRVLSDLARSNPDAGTLDDLLSRYGSDMSRSGSGPVARRAARSG